MGSSRISKAKRKRNNLLLIPKDQFTLLTACSISTMALLPSDRSRPILSAAIILCCGDATDRLQLMRLASTNQVDHVVIISDLIPLKDAVQIFMTISPIMVSAEPIDDTSVSCVRSMAQRQAHRLSTSWSVTVACTCDQLLGLFWDFYKHKRAAVAVMRPGS